MIERGLSRHIEWSCETRLDLVTRDTIDLFYEAGMRGFNVGIESTDPEILKTADRIPIDIAHQNDIIQYCHQKGINVAAFYVLGLESDTETSILNTIAYAKFLNTVVAQFHINTPLPGTPLFKKMSHKIDEPDWSKFSLFNPVYKHDNLTKEQLTKLKDKAWSSYYFRPKYILKHAKTILS